ncbi:MAG: hypothetical protein BWK80_02415 [Desulfobacteraceae bacterium IS3]|nr:MAG: hypothetical protein BWK80_02415 [Desulfobacteraceae bacterium IS3]
MFVVIADLKLTRRYSLGMNHFAKPMVTIRYIATKTIVKAITGRTPMHQVAVLAEGISNITTIHETRFLQ